MQSPSRPRDWVIAAFFVAITPALILAQGPLTPPGAPAPTMKSLDQLDVHVDTAAAGKRTPIDAVQTPGDANNSYVITQPGSYYLTGNLNGVSGKSGIRILTDNVTVDLNGFAVIGVAGSLNGITYSNLPTNICVRNGAVRSWGGSGIALGATMNCLLERLRCSDNGADGLFGGFNSVIRDCITTGNGGKGLNLEPVSTVTGCTSASNTSIGISVGSQSTISHCCANGNGSTGIDASFLVVIKDCVASGNKSGGIAAGRGSILKDCVSSGSTFGGFGFQAANNCMITGCVAENNAGNGFEFVSFCVISGNNSINNSVDGFHLIQPGSLNRIDGNTAIGNIGAGIRWSNDLVIRNNCYGNGVASGNYNPELGGAFGPVQAASNATNPFANF